MGIMRIIKLNMQYVNTVNKCDRKTFNAMLEGILKEVPNGFTSKLYLWNHVRGKEFYKNLSYYVTSKIEQCLQPHDDDTNIEELKQDMNNADEMIKMVMATEKNEDVKRNFIWNITKKIPLLTIDTVKYMSSERISNILASGKTPITDVCLEPFVTSIMELHGQIAELKDSLTIMQNIIT